MAESLTPPPPSSAVDALGRTPIADGMKKQIEAAFRAVPTDKRGAVLIVHDIERNETRAHLAAKIGENWKVAAGGSFAWQGKKPDAFIGIGGSW